MKEPLTDIGVLDSTWGGTLADMVRVVQEVKIAEEEGLFEQAGPKGEYLAEGLRRLADGEGSRIYNVRGMGLYQGFSLENPEQKAHLVETAREKYDLLLLGAGANSIRTRPSLSVTHADIDLFLELLGRALNDL